MPTDKGRSTNHPAENPVAVVGAVSAFVTALAGWAVAVVNAPAPVEAAFLGLAVIAGGVLGRYAQRWTRRVYRSEPPR